MTSTSSASQGGGPPKGTPTVASTHELCKLINNTAQLDPTPNHTHTRANLQGTDLGISVAHQGSLYIFFGDSAGYKAIWPFGESSPDSVGFAGDPEAMVATNPSLLCTDLAFLRLPPSQSLGPGADPAIQADFAAPFMAPPAGHNIGEYIHNPSGTGQFPNLPGSFEVPSGAFSYNGSIYVFYTTVDTPSGLHMVASYLAKWGAPSTTGLPNYDIQYGVDERTDSMGQLGGNFINIAAEVSGQYVYLFGTGDYRKSSVHLARKLLSSLATPGGFEVYDAATSTWKPAPAASAPVIDTPGFGETSVHYYPSIGRWMFLAEDSYQGNRIVARFADAPEGPWSASVVVHDMADAAFLGQYCCVNNVCSGERLFNCGQAGFYGTYLLPHLSADANGSFSVTYTMSTWNPYNVALMSATFNGG